jgi:hypothetical protein
MVVTMYDQMEDKTLDYLYSSLCSSAKEKAKKVCIQFNINRSLMPSVNDKERTK